MKKFCPALECLEDRQTPAVTLPTGSGLVKATLSEGTLTLIGGAADHSLNVNGGTIAGDLDIVGVGTQVKFKGVTAGSATISGVKNIVFKLGDGNDSVAVNNTVSASLNLEGKVRFEGGDGDSQFHMERTTLGAGLRIINGRGFDRIALEDIAMTGGLNVSNGNGATNLKVRRVQDGFNEFASISIVNGRGRDVAQLFDIQVAGDVLIDIGTGDADGAGSPQILNSVNTTTRSFIGGDLRIFTTSGSCDLPSTTGFFENSKVNDVEVQGNVRIKQGSGLFETEFANSATDLPTLIHGNLKISGSGIGGVLLGQGQFLSEPGLQVDGNLDLVFGEFRDTINARNLTVGGVSHFLTGGGDDVFQMNDCTFTRAATFDTGAGDDNLNLATNSDFGIVFESRVDFLLRSGNDSLDLGGSTPVSLSGPALFNGGQGSQDRLIRANLEVEAGQPAPVEVGFEL